MQKIPGHEHLTVLVSGIFRDAHEKRDQKRRWRPLDIDADHLRSGGNEVDMRHAPVWKAAISNLSPQAHNHIGMARIGRNPNKRRFQSLCRAFKELHELAIAVAQASSQVGRRVASARNVEDFRQTC
jgi:hypothetical protein